MIKIVRLSNPDYKPCQESVLIDGAWYIDITEYDITYLTLKYGMLRIRKIENSIIIEFFDEE